MGYQKHHIPVVSGAEAYERVAREYDRDLHLYDEIDLEAYTKALPRELTGLRVLDAGGGTGRWAVRLVKRGAVVTLVDPAPAMLKLAKQKVSRITTVEASVQKLPFPDASFDIVLCAFVLGYVDDLNEALTELTRVLVPGGLLLLTQSPERKSPIHRVGNRDPFLIDVTLHRPEEIVDGLTERGFVVDPVLQATSKVKEVVLGTVITARKV